MKRQQKARVLTLIVLGSAFAVVLWRKTGWKTPAGGWKAETETGPQEAIYQMLDAARQGDVARYLAAYTGQMEASIRQAVAEKSEAAFARYLRESNAEVKGIAITEPQPLTESEMKVRVEYVYADRNEVQFMYLEKDGHTWKISRVDAAQRIPTLVPYGTPVE